MITETLVLCLIVIVRLGILMMGRLQLASNVTIVVKLVLIKIHAILVIFLSTIESWIRSHKFVNAMRDTSIHLL